jgi:hypothetical protein
MTAHNPPNSFAYTDQKAILVDRFNHVVATGWLKAAIFTQQGRQAALIDADKPDGQP